MSGASPPSARSRGERDGLESGRDGANDWLNGPAAPPAPPAGLPAGALPLARRYAREAAARARELVGWEPPRGDAWVRRALLLPLWIEKDWPAPREPWPIGDGAVHADLIDEDVETFERLLEAEPTRDPERLAETAQAWRLPVVPYRRPPVRAEEDEIPAGLEVRRERRAADLRVVDLSALWAGPLLTSLLCAAGMRVAKIDPACRPDGFRARPALYRALNSGKTVVDLDLRRAEDRRRFEALVERADLVVDSFSPRVMPNFGYAPEQLRRINPRIATLSVTAFPARGRERNWLAFGGGVHAASGLACAHGRPEPAPVAYPDALAGLRGFGIALGLLGADGEKPHATLSLLGSLAPLVSGALEG